MPQTFAFSGCWRIERTYLDLDNKESVYACAHDQSLHRDKHSIFQSLGIEQDFWAFMFFRGKFVGERGKEGKGQDERVGPGNTSEIKRLHVL